MQLLGRGGFGEVWKAIGPGRFAVALKFIRLEDPRRKIELRSVYPEPIPPHVFMRA